MKKLFLSLLVIVSLTSFGQGVSNDTAAAKRAQDEANKFVADLVQKTSIKDFQAWLIEMNVGVKDFEVFNNLYTAFIRQKFAQRQQPKK